MLLGLVDLFFGARLREVARALGVPCELLRDATLLVERAAAGAHLVVVDMGARSGDPAAAVRALKADARTCKIPVVGFLHHQDEAALGAARAAGCDRILSRGGLTEKLPDLLRGALK
jgi:DNA-binding NarL/FixJ family response regulator